MRRSLWKLASLLSALPWVATAHGQEARIEESEQQHVAASFAELVFDTKMGFWLMKEPGCAASQRHGAEAPRHSRGPQNAPGTTSLQAKYQGSVPVAIEDRLDLTPDLVKFFVRNGVAMMAPLRKTEVSDADLEALAAYLTQR